MSVFFSSLLTHSALRKAGESGVKGSSCNQKWNNIMRGSTRRSRLGLGVSNWDFPKLGCIEMIDLNNYANVVADFPGVV